MPFCLSVFSMSVCLHVRARLCPFGMLTCIAHLKRLKCMTTCTCRSKKKKRGKEEDRKSEERQGRRPTVSVFVGLSLEWVSFSKRILLRLSRSVISRLGPTESVWIRATKDVLYIVSCSLTTYNYTCMSWQRLLASPSSFIQPWDWHCRSANSVTC